MSGISGISGMSSAASLVGHRGLQLVAAPAKQRIFGVTKLPTTTDISREYVKCLKPTRSETFSCFVWRSNRTECRLYVVLQARTQGGWLILPLILDYMAEAHCCVRYE